MNKADVKEFLTELYALSDKYGIAIDGCGCCESPWLHTINKKKGQDVIVAENLEFVLEERLYKVNFIERKGTGL